MNTGGDSTIMNTRREPPFWTVSLGRLRGLSIRLHASVLFIALAACYFSVEADRYFVGCAFAGSIVAACALRELARAGVRRRYRRPTDCLVIAPLCEAPLEEADPRPAAQAAVAAAGPVANLLAAATAALILGLTGDAWSALLDPTAPLLGTGPWFRDAARAFALVNGLLGVVHLAPAPPLDGATIAAAALRARLGAARSLRPRRLLARCVVIALVSAAFVVWRVAPEASLAGLALGLLGVFLAFSLRRAIPAAVAEPPQLEDRRVAEVARPPVCVDRQAEAAWSQQRRRVVRHRAAAVAEADQQTAAAAEADDDDRLDAVLAKLHAAGRDALTEDEQSLLDRVSRRYRDRGR